LDECLRDIEENITDVRRQLERLQSSDNIRTAEPRGGKLVDTEEARILWLKGLIAGLEKVADKLRADRAS
jgi:hypothetical protein